MGLLVDAPARTPQRLAESTPTSRDDLVRANLPIVHYEVAELSARIPAYVARDELVSAAMFGLAQAARTFDPSRKVPFDRYASIRIRGALLDELRKADWATRSVRQRASQFRNATESLTMRLLRAPTDDEVGRETGLSVDEIHRLRDDVHRATVLNYESVFIDGEFDDVVAVDSDTPEDVVLLRERQAYLVDAVAALPERLRRVIIGYFFEERPMDELAQELGVTDSRISQMRAEAISRLRDGIDSQLDPEALAARAPESALVARRRAAYYAAIAESSDYRSRISADAERAQGVDAEMPTASQTA
jgi:RNA polymerase sigma factor for flagellar operon FliA